MVMIFQLVTQAYLEKKFWVLPKESNLHYYRKLTLNEIMQISKICVNL